jgi:PAS domain S-box-containing protein
MNSNAVRWPMQGPLPWTIAIVTAVATAITYFLAARLSLGLLEESSGVAVFWPAAGIASGVLIVGGTAARWPVLVGVMAATIWANLLGDRTTWSAMVSAIANAGEAAVIAGLVARMYGPRFDLNTLRRVMGFFAATLAGTALSGVVGTMGFVLFHRSTVPFPNVWLHWVASDALGTVTVAPLLIGLSSLVRNPPPPREVTRGALAFAVVCFLGALLVFFPDEAWSLRLAIISVSPLFVWIAARLPPGFTAAAAFICTMTIVGCTTFGIGVFGDSHWLQVQRIQYAQAIIFATSFSALVLAALFNDRRLQERALLERESQFQQALRAGGVMAFEWDLAADKIRHSVNAEQIMGLGSNQVLSRSEFMERVHGEDRSRLTACLQSIAREQPSYSVTFRYMRGDFAGEVWLEQVATALFDSDGLPVSIRGLTTDITARKRFEEELSRAQKAAEQADHAKSIFLAATSHDLRQPLQTLRSLQGALAQRHLDHEALEITAGIGHSIDTMSSVLSILLDINRLETGNLRPSVSDFPINEVFDSVAMDLFRAITQKGLQWHIVKSDLIVRSDRRMLEQMLRNLLSNAIRYTDRGRILLGCRRANDKIRIEVWDSGVGIPENRLPHIFEEYYRDAERGGFGLGLSIVRRLGEILDHKVDVRSTPGKGTGFAIEVPRGRAFVGVAEPVTKEDVDAQTFGGTILIIEDETSVRTALNRLLSSRGIDAVGVATVSEAITLIKQENFRPDVVLSDYNLQGSMNGIESIESLRDVLAWKIPAIVMTGDIRSKTIDAAASYGVSVLVKPFSIEDLIQLISRICPSSELADRNNA